MYSTCRHLRSLHRSPLEALGVLHRASTKSFRVLCAKQGNMSTSVSHPSLVSPEWLRSRIDDDEVKVLDGSWYLPAMERDAVAEFQKERIPGSSFFDVDGIADAKSDYPHMTPAPNAFAAALDELKVENSDFVVVYDGMGVFSAPRVWWTFRTFGHKKVAVLDGGFPAWKQLKYPIEMTEVDASAMMSPTHAAASARENVHYKAAFDANQVCDVSAVKKVVELGRDAPQQIIDARPAPRFQGLAPEPRPGLRMGHMPESINVPFMNLLTEDKRMKSLEELKKVFVDAGVNFDKSHIASCGSGLTACIVIYAMHLLGLEQPALYDASWMEWGGREDTPITMDNTE